MWHFFSYNSVSSVTARIITAIQDASVLDFQHIKSKISTCVPVALINMELEQQDRIPIKKRGYLPFSGRNCGERERERPIKLQAKLAHSQPEKFYKHKG